ncbi:class I adenylate cyclase, partial [Aduncisulcus paluster]
MKFGLLELYTSDSKYSLLCEKLKKNIISGKRRIRRVDPYMRLYQDLANFYRTNENDEYIWLIAMALRLKCGLVSEKEILATPTRAEEIELIDFTMNLSGEESGAFESFKDLSDFGSVAELGRRVNQFMVNTYMKVRGEQDKYP